MPDRPEVSANVWQRFCEAAREYCDVIESVSDYPDADSFHAAVATPLATLYAAGLELPNIPPSDDDLDANTLDTEAWRAVFRAIHTLTGADDPYRTVVNPHKDSDALEASLADDLADVYRDVAPATSWENTEHLTDLQREIRFLFQGHWGRHALEALRAIHWRRGYW